MKSSVTFSASPTFAALRLLAFDSSTPELMLAMPVSGPRPRQADQACLILSELPISCTGESPDRRPCLPPPCQGIYALQPAKKAGVHYLYDLQIRDQAMPGLSGHLEAPALLTRLPLLSWAGEA